MAQLKDLIVNGASRFIGDIFGTNATLNGNILPETNNAQYLGDNTHRWKFFGTLTGNADTTTAANIDTTTNAVAYYTNTTGTFGTKASADGALYATQANGALNWGTLPVAQGGTGATAFTSGELLIGNGTGTVGTRAIKNMTALNNLGWTSNTTDIYIPTVNTLAYWDGRYNNSSSHLTYCAKGAFGNAVTYDVDDATANGALGTGTGLTTERSVYYGLVRVNNASQTRAIDIYAPTIGGTADTQALVGNGTTTAPKWVDINPSISITAGTSSAAPKVNITVLGQSGTTAQAITTATTGVYGVTKLTDAYTSTDAALAVTGKSILAAIQTLDVNAVGVAAATGNRFISQISETDGKISAALATATIGGARQPIYINAGTISAGAITFDSLTANRLMWTTAADKPYAGYHYANSTKIAINSTSEPSQNLYVNGTSYFSDNLTAKSLYLFGLNSTNSTRYITSTAANNIAFSISGNYPFVITDTALQCGNAVKGTINLGASTHRWKSIYAATSIDLKDSSSNYTYLSPGNMELSYSAPYIDFHRANSAADYTARIINYVDSNNSEVLGMQSSQVVALEANGKVAALYSDGNFANWNGNIYAGAGDANREHQIVAQSSAGYFYLYSNGSNGSKGIYAVHPKPPGSLDTDPPPQNHVLRVESNGTVHIGDTNSAVKVVGNIAVETSCVRNISAGTTDLTDGVSDLTTGAIYLVY